VHVASLGFRTDLGINRLSGAEISAREDYIVVRTPANPDYWWGNYVLLPRPLEPGRAERARSVFVSEFPSAPHVAIGVDGTDGDPGDPQAVEELGVKVEVNTVLSAERVRRPARSNGGPGEKATFRPLADDDDWAQAVELRMAVYPEPEAPDHAEFIAGQLAASRQICRRGAGAWFGAFVAGRLVAALGLVAVERGLARYQSVETHPEHRRRGLASRLLYESSRYGRRTLGAHTVVIVADPEDQAIRLYRALGFSGTERQVQLQRPPA
jgi:ribosomal protein S18 acetylase RimI-like enzyme